MTARESMNAINCPRCKRHLPQSAAFCRRCGMTLKSGIGKQASLLASLDSKPPPRITASREGTINSRCATLKQRAYSLFQYAVVFGLPLIGVGYFMAHSFWLRAPDGDRDMPPEQFAKLSGTNTNDGAFGTMFCSDLYNGSAWYVRQITVELRVRNLNGSVALARRYRIGVDVGPLKVEHFESVTGYTMQPGQVLSWRVVAATGHPASQ